MQKTLRDLEAIRLEIEVHRENVRLGLSFPQQPLSIKNSASSSQSGHVLNRLSPLKPPDLFKTDSPPYKGTESTAEGSSTVQLMPARPEYRLDEKPVQGGKAESVKLTTSNSTSQDDHGEDKQSSIEAMNTEPAETG